jgi:hypothetical protein
MATQKDHQPTGKCAWPGAYLDCYMDAERQSDLTTGLKTIRPRSNMPDKALHMWCGHYSDSVDKMNRKVAVTTALIIRSA